jgi:hypothetical protein
VSQGVKSQKTFLIKTQFLYQRKHVTSPLQIPEVYCYVRFEVLTEVNMKNAFFWDLKTQFISHRKHINLQYKAQPVNSM